MSSFRRQRREAARALDATLSPGTWLLRAAVWPVAVAGFFAGIGLLEHDPGVMVPISAIILFWGGALLRRYFRRQDVAALGLASVQPAGSTETTAAVAKPATTAGAAPESELVLLGLQVVRGLRRHGRERAALTLERGLDELRRVEAESADLAVGESEAELLAELARMRSRAESTADPAARGLWTQNGDAVERRIQKRAALSAAHDRVAARVEGFRQAVKSLALDVARLDLAGQAQAELTQVEDQAIDVEQEVESLVRAHDEIVTLEEPEVRSRQREHREGEPEAARSRPPPERLRR